AAPRGLEIVLDLPRPPRLAGQLVLEPGIGYGEHRGDAVAVAPAAQLGDAVFGDEDVAQMARDGGVAVAPQDARFAPALRPARRVERDDRARAVERQGLGDEIVLPADAGNDLPVLQP